MSRRQRWDHPAYGATWVLSLEDLVLAKLERSEGVSELVRAEFILRRLYPEFSDEQLAHIRGELARAEATGTWHAFVHVRGLV